MRNKNLMYDRQVINLQSVEEVSKRTPVLPYIKIYKVLGSSQFIVSTGFADYNFINEDDAQNFVHNWFFTNKKLPITNLNSRQVS